jgi:hypothetical protein
MRRKVPSASAFGWNPEPYAPTALSGTVHGAGHGIGDERNRRDGLYKNACVVSAKGSDMPPIGLQEIKSNRKASAVTEITDSLKFDGKGNTTPWADLHGRPLPGE